MRRHDARGDWWAREGGAVFVLRGAGRRRGPGEAAGGAKAAPRAAATVARGPGAGGGCPCSFL